MGAVGNLASLLEAKGDYSAAEPLYRRDLEASERTLGREHPGTLNAVSNLAGLLRAKGELGQAEVLGRRAVEAMARTLGATHPTTKTAAKGLRLVLKAKGGCEEEMSRLDETHDI